MLIKADEDIPNSLVLALRRRGYDVASISEQGMLGWKDPDVWLAVQSEQRFLVTADKGFGDIRRYPPGTHCGVLVLRPDEDGVRPLVQLIEDVMNAYDLQGLQGALTVATPRGVRIRRP